jgi:hypothetical protein
MGSFVYRLELEHGRPADSPTFRTPVPTWRPGDTVSPGEGRTLRVIETELATEPDRDPVLVVEIA